MIEANDLDLPDLLKNNMKIFVVFYEQANPNSQTVIDTVTEIANESSLPIAKIEISTNTAMVNYYNVKKTPAAILFYNRAPIVAVMGLYDKDLSSLLFQPYINVVGDETIKNLQDNPPA